MSEVMTPELASLLDLATITDTVERLARRVLDLQETITDEKRRRRDLMAHLAVEQVQHADLTARVAMLEACLPAMAPPF